MTPKNIKQQMKKKSQLCQNVKYLFIKRHYQGNKNKTRRLGENICESYIRKWFNIQKTKRTTTQQQQKIQVKKGSKGLK